MNESVFPELVEFFRKRYVPDHSADLHSAESVADYELQIKHFGEWWTSDGRHGAPTIADLQRETITSTMAWFAAKGRSPATVNKLLRVLKALANHAAEVTDLPPPKKIKPYKTAKRKPSAWTEEQMGEMVWVARQLRGQLGDVTRAAFMVAFLLTQYNTGSRISALMRVRWEAIDLTAGILVLEAETTKDNEEQRISLKPETVAALAALRVGNQGGPFDHWPYDRAPDGKRRPWKTLTTVLKKIIFAAMIDTDIDVNDVTFKQVEQAVGRRECSHKIRRTFATEIAARQGIKVAQQMLGHASESTTAAYVDVSRLPKHSARDILPTLVEKPPKWKLFGG